MYKKEDFTNEWFLELEEEVRLAYKDVIYDKLPAIDNVLDYKLRKPLLDISVEKVTSQVYPLFLWLKGEEEIPSLAEEIILDILSLVWINPFMDRKVFENINWDLWAEKSKLGYLIRAVKFNDRPE